MKDSPEIIGFHNVSFSYEKKKVLLYDLEASFKEGNFYFLTGPSGIGKTSFLKLIYRELKPNQGNVTIYGRNLTTLSSRELPFLRRKIGIIFQDCKLFSHLNVLDNVALSLKIRGCDLRKARSQAKELLHWVGLGDFFYYFPETLSDGQKQRAAIARAVITRPPILLADEPTGNMDEENAYNFILLLEELNKTGTTIIMVTHNISLLKNLFYPRYQLNENGELSFYQNSQKLNEAYA